jgi:hypothetical protein
MWKALESSRCQIELFDKIPIECPIAIRLMHNFYKRIKRRPSHHLGFEPAVLEKAADGQIWSCWISAFIETHSEETEET